MNRTVYFADKSVVFTDRATPGAHFAVRLGSGERVSRAKILEIFQTCNDVAVISPDAEAAFRGFAAEFAAVEAAGGIVVDARGAWLMIHRNGRWDLPKGHVEAGETFAECAVREVGEETGVTGAEVVRPLCDTLHAYSLCGRWELKRTHWFEMRAAAGAAPAPQREEGIDRAVWCMPDEVREHLSATFPTLRCVAACMR